MYFLFHNYYTFRISRFYNAYFAENRDGPTFNAHLQHAGDIAPCVSRWDTLFITTSVVLDVDVEQPRYNGSIKIYCGTSISPTPRGISKFLCVELLFSPRTLEHIEPARISILCVLK